MLKGIGVITGDNRYARPFSWTGNVRLGVGRSGGGRRDDRISGFIIVGFTGLVSSVDIFEELKIL